MLFLAGGKIVEGSRYHDFFSVLEIKKCQKKNRKMLVSVQQVSVQQVSQSSVQCALDAEKF